MRARRYTGVVRRAFRASQRLVWLRCVVGGPLLATVAVPTFCRRQPRQRACAPAALRHVGRDLRSARPPGVRRVANRDAVDAAAGAAVLAVAVPILGSPAGRCLEPQAARASLHGLSTLRDPVHGDIELTRDELRLVDTAEFQRLRGIKQLGSAALVYPGAVHTRFEHSIGTLHVCDRLLDACNKNASRDPAGCHRVTDDERRILHNLGYPQPPTLLLCDNECAVGLANKTMVPRLSKSIDMRFHWLQDRIQQRQFRVEHVRGDRNVSDYFTKALPRSKHDQYAPYCATDPVATLPSSLG